jgi:hypothetical protein
MKREWDMLKSRPVLKSAKASRARALKTPKTVEQLPSRRRARQ